MQKDSHITEVIFRKYRKSLGGAILALFPYDVQTYKGDVMCYEHVGQHGSGDYNHCLTITTPATEDEAKELKKELENLGYNLKVIQKKNHAKYLESYYALKAKI